MISYIITFISGIIVGAVGNYLAILWADKTKEKDIQKKRKQQYQKIIKKMPLLIDEIKSDLKNPNIKSCREFFILPNKKIAFNHNQPAFSYYEDEHNQLKSKILILEEANFVIDITETTTPKYKFNEDFIDFLINEK